MKLILEWLWKGEAHSYTIADIRPVLVGRLRKCDIVIADITISRQQAVFYIEESAFHLRNLSQTNLVLVNDDRQLETGQSTTLEAGDTIRFGQVKLEVTAVEKPKQSFKLRCTGCHRAVDISLSDCPWCGTSLAFGSTIIVSADEES